MDVAVRFVEVVNASDTEGLLAMFSDDAMVVDWGRTFRGPDAIRRWSDREFIGARGHLTVQRVEQHGESVDIFADWKSEHYSGPSRFTLSLLGDRLTALNIRDASGRNP